MAGAADRSLRRISWTSSITLRWPGARVGELARLGGGGTSVRTAGAGAFEGRVDLHQQSAVIDELASGYERLQKEALAGGLAS
jgi:hypothetical protein